MDVTSQSSFQDGSATAEKDQQIYDSHFTLKRSYIVQVDNDGQSMMGGLDIPLAVSAHYYLIFAESETSDGKERTHVVDSPAC